VPELGLADHASQDQGTLGLVLLARAALDADEVETPGAALRAVKISRMGFARQFPA